MILLTPVTNRLHARSSTQSSGSVPKKQNSQQKLKFAVSAVSKIWFENAR